MEDLFVNRVRLNRENIDNNKYPFSIKCLNNFEELKLDNSVTLFYGENGVGKSTLIEAIAIALGLNPEGGSNNMQFSNYDDYSDLYKHLKISKFVKLRPMLSGRTLKKKQKMHLVFLTIGLTFIKENLYLIQY